MFSPANFMRYALRRLRIPGINYYESTVKPLTKMAFRPNYKQFVLTPPTLCFSLVTLLGLDTEELSPEDELIQSIKYSILFIQKSELDKAERLLHIALRQAQQMNHENGITYIYDVMANLALQRQQLDKAKKLFVSVAQRLMQRGVKDDDIRIIHISLKLARISHLQREFQIAQTGFEFCSEKLKRQYKLDPNETNAKLLSMCEDWYGKLYLECENPEKALELLEGSHERMKSIGAWDEEHLTIQLNDIGTVYEKLDRLEESEKCLKEAVERGKKTPDMPDLELIYVNLGRVYLKRGLVNEARKSCGYAWRLSHDRNNDAGKQLAQKCVEEVNKAR